jgi:hypothetical protein
MCYSRGHFGFPSQPLCVVKLSSAMLLRRSYRQLECSFVPNAPKVGTVGCCTNDPQMQQTTGSSFGILSSFEVDLPTGVRRTTL